MIELLDGRSKLYQWDTDRYVVVDTACTQVHFRVSLAQPAIPAEVEERDGKYVAPIPPELLQDTKDVVVYAFSGSPDCGYTKEEKVFEVVPKPKPADYVFTPTEQITMQKLEAIIKSVREDADSGKFNGDPGPQGPSGPPGPKGDPGTSVSHQWDGTKLIITSASGTSSTDLGVDIPVHRGRGEHSIVGEVGCDASGDYSLSLGHDTKAISHSALSFQEIEFISYKDNVLTLKSEDNFFDNNSIYAFRIENFSKKLYMDIVRVIDSVKDGDNWRFTIEEPVSELSLEVPSQTLVYAIVNDNKVNTNHQYAGGYNSYAIGEVSHAEGIHTLSAHEYTHSEGWGTVAYGRASHAEGYSTKSIGNFCHTEGVETEASGSGCHAEGGSTKAYSYYSHAEGYQSIAVGNYSHAEGEGTNSAGQGSHTEGLGTQANGDYQHAQGKWNIIDKENKYAHIVGNGTSNIKRANIHTLEWNGNAWYAGTITAGRDTTDKDSDLVLVTKGYMKSHVEEYANNLVGYYTPSVDSNGNLKWTPSKSTLPTVDSVVNIKGPKGDKGDKGDTGEKGNPGDDGISPVVTFTQIDNGYALTIAARNGSSTVEILNGKDGEQGPKGDSYILTDSDKADIIRAVSAEITAELNAALLEIKTIQEDLMTPDGDEVKY